MNCVHKDYGINAFKRSLLPFFHNRKGFIRDSTDETVWYFKTVDIFDVWWDIVSCHTLGVHWKNLFFNITCERCFVFLDYLRLKIAVSVTRYCYLNRTGTCFDWLSAVSVPAVLDILVSIVILAVSEFVVQLCFKSVFKNLSDHFLEYRTKLAVILYIQ